MNRFHQELLKKIKKVAKKPQQTSDDINYLGTKHFHYGLSVPQLREIIKQWVKKHANLKIDELIALLISLSAGNSYAEKTTVGSLLHCYPKLRKQIDPKILDELLEDCLGWAEVDSLCQSTFNADEILSKWNNWKKVITQLNKNKNPHKKRASLVLMTKAVRDTNDQRLLNLALRCIDTLKTEKDILITKSISWLLRDMIKNFRTEVTQYLNQNSDSLPKVALREVKNKLTTGKK